MVKNRYIILYLLFLLVFSCKKKEEVKGNKTLNATEYFSISTNLNNLKELKKSKINDSLYNITGYFGSYEITGQIKENNLRVGWWEARNKKNKILIAKLEYRIVDSKEFINQYILFKNGRIDTLKSKFYRLSKNSNTIKYKFYMPIQSKEIHSEGKLNYKYFFRGKVKEHIECKGIKNKNIFNCEFSVPVDFFSNELIIKGNFWEMFQLENGDIGQNDIYILDTLK